MNLWVKKAGLILGSALFIFACEEPGEIGLDLNPEQENFVVSSIEIPIDLSVGIMEPYYVRDYVSDTLVYTTDKAYVGKFMDETFGPLTIEGYLEPNLYKDPLSLSQSSVLDTVELRLYLDSFYGYKYNVTGPQKINVYELTSTLKKSGTHDDKYEYNSNPLAEITFELDTVVSSKFISVDLPLDFGHKIFDATLNDTLRNKLLLEVFKGLAFVPGPDNDILFNVNSQTHLVYDYRVQDSYPSDSAKSFIVNFVDPKSMNTSGNLSYDIAFHPSDIDLTGTELEDIVIGGPLKHNTEKGYLHPILGAYVELDFTPLLSLRDSLGVMVVNSASFAIENIPYDTGKYYLNTISAFEKGENFDFAHLAIYTKSSREDYGLGDNLKFTLGRTVDKDNEIQSFKISGVARTKYTPFERSPLFEDYIQSVMSDSKYRDMEELKILLTPGNLGASLAPLAFDKDKVKLKVYFSYLKNQ